MKRLVFVLFLSLSMYLAGFGCASRYDVAAAGGLLGAGIGAVAAHKGDKARGAAIGGAIGAGVGLLGGMNRDTNEGEGYPRRAERPQGSGSGYATVPQTAPSGEYYGTFPPQYPDQGNYQDGGYPETIYGDSRYRVPEVPRGCWKESYVKSRDRLGNPVYDERVVCPEARGNYRNLSPQVRNPPQCTSRSVLKGYDKSGRPIYGTEIICP
jgi:hypothetical protein